MAAYFSGNFFVNTPDILPEVLQRGGPPAFRMRATLAATLASVWGVYSGFELGEAAALPGSEEYQASEKYEIRVRDWDAPGNLKDHIARLNTIRRENRALHSMSGLRFYPSAAHVSSTADDPARDGVILVAEPRPVRHPRGHPRLRSRRSASRPTDRLHRPLADQRRRSAAPATPRASIRGPPPTSSVGRWRGASRTFLIIMLEGW
jgi:hypothetical protein